MVFAWLVKFPPDCRRTDETEQTLCFSQITARARITDFKPQIKQEDADILYNLQLAWPAFSCQMHWVGCLHAAALCCLLPKSFTQLLVSRQLLSYTTSVPLWARLQPHCLLAYEILSAQQSERTVTHREDECVHIWEQRKWTTQEPLSQPIVREPPEVGGMRGKLCLRNEGQSMCVCVYIGESVCV